MPHLLLASLLCLSLTVPTVAAPPSPASGRAPAPVDAGQPAQGDDAAQAVPADALAAAMEQVPADHTNVFVLGDALPPVQDLLRHEGVRSLFQDGGLMQLLMERSVDEVGVDEPLNVPDPDTLLAEMDANADNVPVAVVVAAPDDLLKKVGLGLEMLFEAMALEVEPGGQAIDAQGNPIDDIGAAQQALAKRAVKELANPRLTIVVTLRDEALALQGQQVMAMGMLMSPNAEMLEDGSGAVMTLRVADLKAMNDSGFPGDEVEGDAEEIDPFAGLDDETLLLRASVRRVGTMLVIHLGDPLDENAARLAMGKLDTPFDAQRRPLAFAQWNLEPLLASFERIHKDQDVWDRRLKAAHPGEGTNVATIFGTVGQMYSQQIKMMGARGSLAMRIDDGLEWTLVQRGMEPGEAVDSAELIHAVPAGAAGYMVTGRQSLGDMAHMTLENFAMMGDIAEQGAADMEDQEARQLQMTFRMMTDLNEKYGKQIRETFEGPYAIVTSLDGKLSSLTVRDGEGEDASVRRWKDVPLPEYALITRVSDADKARELAQQVGARLEQFRAEVMKREAEGEGDGEAVEKKAAADELDLTVEEADLGLGVKTYVVDGVGEQFLAGLVEGYREASTEGDVWEFDDDGQLIEPEPATPAGSITAEAEGDLRVHIAVVDDHHLLVSTSPRLSKAMLAQMKAGGKPTLPAMPKAAGEAGAGEGKLVLAFRADPEAGATFLENAKAWVDSMQVSGKGPLAEDAPTADDRADNKRLLDAVAEAVRLLEPINGTSVQRGDVVTTEFEVKLK